MGKRKREREKQLLGTWPPTTVNVYIAELRKLSNDCDYGESLNEMLRDRLVCGVKDNRIQRRLLAEPELTFTIAMTIAQAMEATEMNAKELRRPAAVEVRRNTYDAVHYQKKEQEGSTKPCKHCGKTNHQEELHGKKKNPE